MTTLAPPITAPLDLLETHHHAHGSSCWWNHLEARWICAAAPVG